MHLHRSNITLRTSALSLAITVAGASLPVAAQPEGRATALEEIVVTAQRREASLQDTPISITAFTEAKLADIGAFDVTRVADFTPNVLMLKQPSSNVGMNLAIRGIGEGDPAVTADPKVGLYIDGVYTSKTASAVFDVIDLERIEVLRGPQGTLFGRNSTGGAVNVITRKPSGTLATRLEGSLGNYGYSRMGGSIDLPAVADVATKISYARKRTDGWADNNYTGPAVQPALDVEEDLGSQDNESYRIALRWTPREDLTIDYSYYNVDYTGVPTPHQIVAVKTSMYDGFNVTPFDFAAFGGSLYQQMARNVGDPDKRKRDFDFETQTEEYLEVDSHTFTAEWSATDHLAIKYIYANRDTSFGYGGNDLDGGAYTARDLFYGVFQGNSGAIPTAGFAASDTSEIDMETHEFQFIGDALDDRLKYTAGVFFYEENTREENPQTLALPIAFVAQQGAFTPDIGQLYDAAGFCPAAYYGYLCVGTQRLPIPGATDSGIAGMIDNAWGQKSESVAIYGQGTYAITEELELTLGVRYTEDEKDAFLFNQNMSGYTRESPIRAGEEWNNTSYLANLRYAVTDEASVYLSYSTGYNSGGFSARATNAPAFQAPFDKEEVEAWEMGLKSQWWDNRARLNMAVFHNTFTDLQVPQFEAGAGGSSSRTVNAGEMTLQGIEIDAVIVPVEGFTIDLSYGYLHHEFDEYIQRNPATDLLEDISDRVTLPHAPENSASLGLQYDFTPFSFGALSARVDVSYKDKVVFHPFQNQYDSTDDRTLVDARLSLNDIAVGAGKGTLRVSLWGKNLGDEEYRAYGIDWGSLGFAGVNFGEPRTYGMDVVYTLD